MYTLCHSSIIKLTEKITTGKSYHGHAGSPRGGYSLDDKPIDELIANLEKEGLSIKREFSQKEMEYTISTGSCRSENKKAILPLDTEIKGTIEAYYLHDEDGLTLELRDYNNVTERPRKGVIGGMYGGEAGIICKLRVEQQVIDTSVVDKVRNALQETYDPQGKKIRDAFKAELRDAVKGMSPITIPDNFLDERE